MSHSVGDAGCAAYAMGMLAHLTSGDGVATLVRAHAKMGQLGLWRLHALTRVRVLGPTDAPLSLDPIAAAFPPHTWAHSVLDASRVGPLSGPSPAGPCARAHTHTHTHPSRVCEWCRG